MNAFKIWVRKPYNIVLLCLMACFTWMGIVAYQVGDIPSVIELLGHVTGVVVAMIAIQAATGNAR